MGAEVTPVGQMDWVHLTETDQQNHEGYGSIMLNTETQDSASGENRDKYILQRGEKVRQEKMHCNSV